MKYWLCPVWCVIHTSSFCLSWKHVKHLYSVYSNAKLLCPFSFKKGSRLKTFDLEHRFRNVQMRDRFDLGSLRCKCFYMFFSTLHPHEGQLSSTVVICLICMFSRACVGFLWELNFPFCRLKNTHIGWLWVSTPRCASGWCVCSHDGWHTSAWRQLG